MTEEDIRIVASNVIGRLDSYLSTVCLSKSLSNKDITELDIIQYIRIFIDIEEANIKEKI